MVIVFFVDNMIELLVLKGQDMEKRSHWSGRLSFVLAAAGSAVGLGNIWKFPYVTGQNGGGAFVLTYLLTIAVVGFPIFISELYIGQKSQTDPVNAFRVLDNPKSPFRAIGYIGLICAFTVLSFYSVVGGWILNYLAMPFTGELANYNSETIGTKLDSLFASPLTIIAWHSVFMIITALIVRKGISGGIERISKLLMPLFMILLLGLLAYSTTLPGFDKSVTFLFYPDFTKLSSGAILEAVGHSFFTLSLGMAAMITYGSYLDENENLVKTAASVVFLDTVIALIAGVVIFSITFSFNQTPGQGPGLMFVTLPQLFLSIPFGIVLYVSFFTLVTFAAITSAIALLEVLVTIAEDEKVMDRNKGTVVLSLVCWATGVLCALSFNVFKGRIDFFDIFDKVSSSVLMPLGGILIAIFMGWKVPKSEISRILNNNRLAVLFFMLSTRFIAPVGVFIVMIFGIKHWIQS